MHVIVIEGLILLNRFISEAKEHLIFYFLTLQHIILLLLKGIRRQ